MKKTCRTMLLLCAVLTLLLGYALPAQATSFNEVDGQPIHTQKDLDSLKTGDTLVLLCPNCHAGKMVVYNSEKDSPGHVNWMQPGNTMTCSECGGHLKAVEKDGKIVYVCDKCKAVSHVVAFKTSEKN